MKELLEKYWNELEHYKNGGKLAGRRWIIDPNDGDSSFTIWYEIDSCSTWMMKDLLTNPQDRLELIINDEYSEFRKALAEGKVIESKVRYTMSNNSCHYGEELSWSIDTSGKFKGTPNLYRIKPDESKFKVGDFVRYVRAHAPIALEINNINGNRYYFTNSEMSCLEHELEPWTPVKGEWCWFYDSKSSKSSYLAEFKQMSRQFFESEEIGIYDYCEPFFNSMPSYFKDK